MGPARIAAALLAAGPAAAGGRPDLASPGEAGEGEERVRAGTPAIEVIGGELAVVLSAEAAEAVGLRTQTLAPARRRLAWGAWVEVVDTSTLVTRRNDYELSRAAEQVSEVDMQTARAEYRRLVDLGEGGRIVSPQELRRALGAFQRQQALVRAERIRQATIRDAVAHDWGPELADRILRGAPEDDLLADLVERRRVLLRLTLPPGRSLAGDLADRGVGAGAARKTGGEGDAAAVRALPPAAVDVVVSRGSMPAAAGGTRLAARLLAPAPATDRTLQGETWFLTAPADRLRTGMRVAAEVVAADDAGRDRSGDADSAAASGTLVPEEAVLWHDGRPWVYAQVAEGAWARRDLSSAVETRDGWFVAAGSVAPGDVVVTGGATTLLSEEYRWQIPTEDDDDD